MAREQMFLTLVKLRSKQDELLLEVNGYDITEYSTIAHIIRGGGGLWQ